MSAGEFDEIMQWSSGVKRPVMAPPPPVVATSKFIREVRAALGIADDDRAREAADWIVDKMERFGASTAEPVFDMQGNGPRCSWCGTIWPLCGHHHQSEVMADPDATEAES